MNGINTDRSEKMLGRRLWLPIALLFVLLCIVVWLNELLDLPWFLAGGPPTPTNWSEALIETILIIGIGIFAVRRVLRDITAYHKAMIALREERDKTQTYLNIAGVIIVAIDFNQNVILINKKGAEILGYKQEEIIGKNWFENFIPERAREEVLLVFLDLMGRNVETATEVFERGVEKPVVTKGGEERIIYWQNSVLMDDDKNIIGTISSGEDITDRKKAEEELAKQHEHLEEQVAARTAELRRMVDAMALRVVRVADLETKIEDLRNQIKVAGLVPVIDEQQKTEGEGGMTKPE